jgi:myo-inositol-1(or 4)-monophosphatase
MVTTFDGSAYDIFNNRIVASNGLIHDEMVAMLAAVPPAICEDENQP